MTDQGDPFSYDLGQRHALARSILGHVDGSMSIERIALQMRRALAALDGLTIDQIMETVS